MKRGFGSDNHSGVHPRYLEAITRANVGHAPAYGTDEWTAKAENVIQSHFGPASESYFVFNGTGANVLAIGALIRPHHSVLAAEQSHILNDECGAPEKSLGCKLISIPAADGKLRPELIRPYLIRRGDQHFSQAKLISITQPTEVGTLYSVQEIRALGEFAQSEGLFLHVDGARLPNAAVALGCSFREMTTDCGADVVSFGGTKNGLLFGEAVIFLKPGLAKDFKFLRKQLMQLPSKTRFVSAQFAEFLGTSLWEENARVANESAARLARGLSRSPFVSLTQKCQANGVFVRIPKPMVPKLREKSFFYVWNEATFECRLMTSWDTTPTDVDEFLAEIERRGSELGVST